MAEISITFYDADGWRYALTVEGEGQELFDKAEKTKTWISSKGFTPTPPGATSTNGSGPVYGGLGAHESPAGWCAIHNVQMKRRENDSGAWYSHKAPEGGWCNGKPKKAAQPAQQETF